MTATLKAPKPLARKAYGSIGHLPNSRLGPGDHHVNDGQARICTEKARKGDIIIVQEKLDGSCVAVANIDGEIVPLTRAGYPAESSPYEQHHLFAAWVREDRDRFRGVIDKGERLVGEWLAQAHGTRYDLGIREPFVAFDIMRGAERCSHERFDEAVSLGCFATPQLLSYGAPISVEKAMKLLGRYGYHGATDPVEGIVYRVERLNQQTWQYDVDFLAKYVRPDKVDGCYLSSVTGQPEVWNWRPETE
jgi:hypothetical protein